MELQGKVIAALPARSGVSQRGEWTSQDFVIETHDTYPRKMVFSVFGADRLQRFNIQVGQEVLVAFDIDAHEYQGRWFNNIRAFDVRLQDPNAIAGPQDPFPPTVPAVETTQAPAADNGANSSVSFPSQQEATGEGGADDLPF